MNTTESIASPANRCSLSLFPETYAATALVPLSGQCDDDLSKLNLLHFSSVFVSVSMKRSEIKNCLHDVAQLLAS